MVMTHKTERFVISTRMILSLRTIECISSPNYVTQLIQYSREKIIFSFKHESMITLKEGRFITSILRSRDFALSKDLVNFKTVFSQSIFPINKFTQMLDGPLERAREQIINVYFILMSNISARQHGQSLFHICHRSQDYIQ